MSMKKTILLAVVLSLAFVGAMFLGAVCVNAIDSPSTDSNPYDFVVVSEQDVYNGNVHVVTMYDPQTKVMYCISYAGSGFDSDVSQPTMMFNSDGSIMTYTEPLDTVG